MMTWNPRANDLFLRASELRSADKRQAYLDEACAGDAALRAEVESLLQASARAGSFLESPALGIHLGATADDPISERPGTIIGPYKLMEQIGEGGFGVVFMAEQIQPVRRKVALKILKAGMDTRQVVARFEAERQTLALMDHPNIARVLDGGATESGRPFFVMELIRGIPITKYCDDNRLTVRERLELLVPVCQAIHHAHQKETIHRDIKPSNVLVTLYDAKPMPKIIDFGIAKAAGQPLTEKSVVTGLGMVIGTIEYMSPEQAELNQHDIDTRSDVYCLGVLLYELLTGSTPLDHHRLKEKGILDILHSVREEEPPKPSDRLRSSSELPRLSVQRSLEPAKLIRLVKGELDWIVMRTLEKDRSRRYETAAGLANELQRYLADEPVQAVPPSFGYRFRKFLKRRRKPLLATAMLAALLACLIGTTLLALQWHETQGELQAKMRRTEDERHAAQLDLALRALERNDVAEAERVLSQIDRAYDETWEQRHLRWLCRGVHRLDPILRGNRLNENGKAAFDYSAAVSPDGLQIASLDHAGGGGATLKICELATGHEESAIPTGLTSVAKPLFSPDGRRVALARTNSGGSGWDQGLVVIFTVPSGYKTLTLRSKNWNEASLVESIAYSSDGRCLVAKSRDGRVSVWDTGNGREVFCLCGEHRLTLKPPHVGRIGVALSPDGERIVTLNGEQKITMWNLATASPMFTLPRPVTVSGRMTVPGHWGEISRDSFSPDGKRLALVADGSGKILDATSGRELTAIKNNDSRLERLAFNPDGNSLVGITWDGRVKTFVSFSGICSGSVEEEWVIDDVLMSSDGRRMAAVSRTKPPGEGQRVRLWNTGDVRNKRLIEFPGQTVVCLFFTGSRAHIITSAPEGIRVWDEEATLQQSRTVEGKFLRSARCVAISADGRLIAAGGGEHKVMVWDAMTGQEKRWFWVKNPDLFTEHPLGKGRTLRQAFLRQVSNVCFGSDSRRLAAACAGDKTVRVWDVETGEEVLTLRGHQSALLNVVWSQNGQRIASSSGDGTIRIWDAQTGQEQLVIPKPGRDISIREFSLLAISPDGSLVIGPGRYEQHNVRGWIPTSLPAIMDATTGNATLNLQGTPGPQYLCAAFSWDGRRIVMGDEYGTLRVWDATTGKEQLVLNGHTGEVFCVAFSPDGQRIVSGSAGLFGSGRRWPGELKLWDAFTGVAKLSFGHSGAVAFSPDGQRLVSAGGAVRVWEAMAGKP